MLEQLEQGVIDWAFEKGIIEHSDAISQFKKMDEEVDEYYEALMDDKPDEIKLELGDVFVTAIIHAKLHGLSAAECIEAALNKITKRTGKMEDGVFVKD
ncbi:hypothetical protein LCGC14_2843460, partial [marine sediment metagenome]